MPTDSTAERPNAATALTQALDRTLDDGAGGIRPLGDPRQPDVIRAWAELTAGVETADLEDALSKAVAALGADRAQRARLLAAGLLPDVPVQMALIAGYVRMFRRIRHIMASGGQDDAALMAETRRDMRALNAQMAEALGTIRDQRLAMNRMNKVLVNRERRQARTTVELAQAKQDLTDARTALAHVEAERDEARQSVEALRADRDGLRRELNRTRAGVEDLKAKYLEKFALALHDLNRARSMLYNDPRSTLPAMKATVAQGYYMILEDMGASAEARKLMASIVKGGL